MFKERSKQKEYLDGEVEQKDLILNLKELHTINYWLGGYSISIKAFKNLNLQNKVLVDIGSGGGDMLNEIYEFTKKRNINLRLIGVDIKEECITYSKQHLSNNLEFVCDDYRNILNHTPKIDYLHACLFTHHLSNEQIIELIQFSLKNNFTLIINDLHRNWFAYFSIKFLTLLFSKSYLVKNDAPLSVLRGFSKKEWLQFLHKAGAHNYDVSWKWAFRHLIIVYG